MPKDFRKVSNKMPKDFRRLTNPRDAVEHNHNTLPWVIVAEHGSKAASSSDFP